ncbi:MAG: hypothetical protein H0W20_13750 [Chthoniobacterales bacterium]|nr:hypothetical protein [Chthoniobacterales bacterium]
MRSLAACLVMALVLGGAGMGDAKKPRSTLRAHLEANANDGTAFSTQIRSGITGKNVVIEKVPTISEQDVVAFYPYQAPDGSYGVLFQLNDHGKLALDTLSVERRGRFLYVFVNGRPAAELQVDRRVSDGKLYVESGLTAADVALMKKEWRLIGERKKRG